MELIRLHAANAERMDSPYWQPLRVMAVDQHGNYRGSIYVYDDHASYMTSDSWGEQIDVPCAARAMIRLEETLNTSA